MMMFGPKPECLQYADILEEVSTFRFHQPSGTSYPRNFKEVSGQKRFQWLLLFGPMARNTVYETLSSEIADLSRFHSLELEK